MSLTTGVKYTWDRIGLPDLPIQSDLRLIDLCRLRGLTRCKSSMISCCSFACYWSHSKKIEKADYEDDLTRAVR